MKINSKLPFIICTSLFAVILLCTLFVRHFETDAIRLTGDESVSVESSQVIIEGKININRATQKDLTMLPGIGDTLAHRIVEYRSTHGAFHKPEDLLNIKGIGNAKLDDIADYIFIGGTS